MKIQSQFIRIKGWLSSGIAIVHSASVSVEFEKADPIISRPKGFATDFKNQLQDVGLSFQNADEAKARGGNTDLHCVLCNREGL